MLSSQTSRTYCIAAYSFALLFGPISHLTLWIHGEWDTWTNILILSFLLSHTTAVFNLSYYGNVTISVSFLEVLKFESIYAVSLTISIILYRIFFHPLRRFPGPKSYCISIWSKALDIFNHGERGAVLMDQLHSRYGDYIRTGPNHLSINNAGAVPLVYGAGRKTVCHKSGAYINPGNPGSVNATRDPTEHELYRKIWDKALDPKLAPSYLPAIHEHIDISIERLKRYEGQPTEVNHELSLFAFDMMSRVGFGIPEGFGSMKTGKHPQALTDLILATRVGVYMMMIPWLHVITGMLPTFGLVRKADIEFRKFVEQTLEQRSHLKARETKSQPGFHNDIVGHLLARQHNGVKLSHSQILSNGFIIGLAGSDTTISTITHLVYFLAHHEDRKELLLCEINSAVPGSVTPEDWPRMSKLPYLDAVINESLRLYPPNPSPLPRTTPQGGLSMEDGTFIPGGVNVLISEWSLHRDPRNFVDPDAFVPERWLTHDSPRDSRVPLTPRPDMILEKRAFIPFLRGPYRCAGIYFAYMELKMWLVKMLKTFDMVFPDGADLAQIDRAMAEDWKDYTMMQAAKLHVRFIAR